jgi:hypothetical protein
LVSGRCRLVERGRLGRRQTAAVVPRADIGHVGLV